MHGSDFPVVKDIVLLGGGHSHVSVLRNFGMHPINGVRLTLISPEVATPYSGMLPGLIAGHYTFDETHIDLGPLARFASARFLETAAERIDPNEKLIYCADGRPPVPYDLLSINTGSTPVFDQHLVLKRNVFPVKPVSEFLDHWPGLQQRVLHDPSRRVGIVGAGAGGVELLLSVQYAIARAAGAEPDSGPGSFHVFTRDDRILRTHGPKVRAAMQAALDRRGVTVHTSFDVRTVDDVGVSNGDRIEALDEVLWVTGAQPPPWLGASGFDVDASGFIAVDTALRSTSHADVFAAGDVASMIADPRPKSGVFAVRQGPRLARNLRARALGKRVQRYQPQRRFLSLISTGDKNAIASWGGWSVKGEWVWRWKDHIDRAFMTKFNDLPRMDDKRAKSPPTVADLPQEIVESLAPDAMRCGGCGAKVGPAVLRRALAKIGIGGMRDRPRDIVLGPGDDAAAIDVPPGQLLVQTVDSFPAMIDDPYTFGRITANHCLGDIFAMGATPHSALVIVALPFAPDEKREADLLQVLAGAQKVLSAVGCQIAGGHTGEGKELTLGLSLNGFSQSDSLTSKSGLTDGLALILTKPIGTGALFAAHGRGQTKGRWVQGAIANALHSNAAAAQILRAHGARSVTDVTGFGLAGHLTEMLEASNVAANLELAKVPILVGAIDVTKQGIKSSLHDKNQVWRDGIEAPQRAAELPEFQLLFDPQTAGGLLAGLPKNRAGDAIFALQEAGCADAAIIGETVAQDGRSSLIRLLI